MKTLLLIIPILLLSSCTLPFAQQKQTISLSEKVALVDSLRAQKSELQKQIADLDMKIIKNKCELFKEVKAEDQWNNDCAEAYKSQQAVLSSNPEK